MLAHTKRELAVYTKQLAVSLNSGIPLYDALEVVGESNRKFERLTVQILMSLGSGHTLSKSLRPHSKIFSPLFIRLVQVGEQTGGLYQVFGKLADWLERETEVLSRTQTALMYPLVVVLVTLACGFITTVAVLPPFVDILTQLNAPLPLPSRLLISAISIVSHPVAWLVGGGAIASWVYFLKQWLSAKDGRRTLELLLLSTPGLGTLCRDLTLARLFFALEMALEVGLDSVRSLRVASRACGSVLIEEDFNNLHQAIMEGSTINEYLVRRPEFYPPHVVGLFHVGEESGKLSAVVRSLARFYEDEVEYRQEMFLALIEPLLIGLVSFFSGCVMVALLLPLYNVLLTL